MPPLEPGADVVTIMRSGRPTESSPALRRRACEPSCAVGRISARLAKLSRNARMPIDLTCSRVSGCCVSASCCSAPGSGSGGSSSTSSGSGSGSSSGTSGSCTGAGGGGGVRSWRTSLATRSGSTISSERSLIGIAIMLSRMAMASDVASDVASERLNLSSSWVPRVQGMTWLRNGSWSTSRSTTHSFLRFSSRSMMSCKS